ncbi:MAG: hypothetical protein ACFFF4_01460 [Candidatus Thorarchaeota archaeon]
MESIKTTTIVFLAVIFCIGITIHPVAAEEYPIVSRGESFNITATLLTNGTSGIPIPNQIVYFYDQTWNSLLVTTETDIYGKVSIDYSFPLSHPLGNTLLNITFRGNVSLALAPTCQWFTLLVMSSTNIGVSIPKSKFAPNDNLDFSVHLLDDLTNPVGSANLSLFCDNIFILNLQTNETGYAFTSIFLDPAEFSLGNHSIEVRYDGDLLQFYRGTSISFDFEINQVYTEFEILSISQSPIMLTELWNTTLYLSSDEGPLSGESVLIMLDDSYLDTTNTDTEGFVSFSYPISDLFTIGQHSITFEYDGTERYKSSIIDISLEVGTPLNLSVIPLGSAEIGKNLTLEIDALDAFLRPISDGVISIIDPTTNISLTTFFSNQSQILVQFPIEGEKGFRKLYLNITKDNLLKNNSFVLSLDIWTRPIVEIISSNILGFASPQQIVSIDVILEDYRGPLSERIIQFILPSANETIFVNTKVDGSARIEFQSPNLEGYYCVYITYQGNQTDYELSYSKEYSFSVSQTIPLQVILKDYEIIAPLASIRVKIQLQALNGSYPEGILIEYSWLSSDGITQSGTNGISEFHISIPPTAGIHILQYQIDPIGGLDASSGMIYIITTSQDANATEGIGLYGLIIGLTISIGIAIIPEFRRRFLVG